MSNPALDQTTLEESFFLVSMRSVDLRCQNLMMVR